MESSEDQFAARLANLNINQEIDYINSTEPNTPSVQGNDQMVSDLAKANSEIPG